MLNVALVNAESAKQIIEHMDNRTDVVRNHGVKFLFTVDYSAVSGGKQSTK